MSKSEVSTPLEPFRSGVWIMSWGWHQKILCDIGPNSTTQNQRFRPTLSTDSETRRNCPSREASLQFAVCCWLKCDAFNLKILTMLSSFVRCCIGLFSTAVWLDPQINESHEFWAPKYWERRSNSQTSVSFYMSSGPVKVQWCHWSFCWNWKSRNLVSPRWQDGGNPLTPEIITGKLWGRSPWKRCFIFCHPAKRDSLFYPPLLIKYVTKKVRDKNTAQGVIPKVTDKSIRQGVFLGKNIFRKHSLDNNNGTSLFEIFHLVTGLKTLKTHFKLLLGNWGIYIDDLLGLMTCQLRPLWNFPLFSPCFLFTQKAAWKTDVWNCNATLGCNLRWHSEIPTKNHTS